MSRPFAVPALFLRSGLFLGGAIMILISGAVGAEDSMRWVDFSSDPPPEWVVVNDGVMGGISESRMAVEAEGRGVFSGYLSLEHNGGFASVRTRVEARDLSSFDGVVLRVRGDERRYQLRFRTDSSFDGIAYRALFDAGDSWEEIRIPFTAFTPTFRGRSVPGAPTLDPSEIRQLTLMIADSRQGNFRTEVEWVDLYRQDD